VIVTVVAVVVVDVIVVMAGGVAVAVTPRLLGSRYDIA